MTAPSSPAPQRPSAGEASFGVSVAMVGSSEPDGAGSTPGWEKGPETRGWRRRSDLGRSVTSSIATTIVHARVELVSAQGRW